MIRDVAASVAADSDIPFAPEAVSMLEEMLEPIFEALMIKALELLYALQAVDDDARLTKPLGMPTFTTETAANTLAQIGAGEYVISGKRRSYDEVMATENQAAIEALQVQVNAMASASSASSGSVDDADDGAVNVMHGAGTTNPSKLFWESMQLITERARLPLKLSYRAVGSSTGQKEFLGVEGVNTQQIGRASCRERV